MIPRKSRVWLIAGAALGAAMLAAGVPAQSSAQQLDSAGRVARPAAKPVTAAASKPARDTKAKPWSIEDALPKNSRAIGHPVDDSTNGSAAGLGRVPLRAGQGSFGIETETKFKANELPDGRPIPGLAKSAQQPSQYLGLSLSVPTDSKSMGIPVPPWNRSE